MDFEPDLILHSAIDSERHIIDALIDQLPAVQQHKARPMPLRRRAHYVTDRMLLVKYAKLRNAGQFQIHERDGLGPRFTVDDKVLPVSISHSDERAVAAFSHSDNRVCRLAILTLYRVVSS